MRCIRASAADLQPEKLSTDRLKAGVEAIKDIVGKVWPRIIADIAVGALIHGFERAHEIGSLDELALARRGAHDAIEGRAPPCVDRNKLIASVVGQRARPGSRLTSSKVPTRLPSSG